MVLLYAGCFLLHKVIQKHFHGFLAHDQDKELLSQQLLLIQQIH